MVPRQRCRWTNRLRQEEGAVAVTTAIAMLALIGFTMLAVDGGSMWASRRNVIADTDAAALAAAREIVRGNCSALDTSAASNAASAALVANDPTVVEDGDPSIVCVGTVGRASVSAHRPTSLAFGGLVGFGSVDVASTSIAQAGYVIEGIGMRPIAVCASDPHLLEYQYEKGELSDADILAAGGDEGATLLTFVQSLVAGTDPDEHPVEDKAGNPVPTFDGDGNPEPEVHRIEFTRTSVVSLCGEGEGNWGWIDFNGGGGGSNAIGDWLRNGYDQPVTVGPDEDCAPEIDDETSCLNESGAGGGSFDKDLETIYCPAPMTVAECAVNDLAFPIVLFTTVVCDNADKGVGGGKDGCNAKILYDPEAFLGVVLRNWTNITGKPNDTSWFGFQFLDPFIMEGTISPTPPGPGPAVLGMHLCGGGYGQTIDDEGCLEVTP